MRFRTALVLLVILPYLTACGIRSVNVGSSLADALEASKQKTMLADLLSHVVNQPRLSGYCYQFDTQYHGLIQEEWQSYLQRLDLPSCERVEGNERGDYEDAFIGFDVIAIDIDTVLATATIGDQWQASRLYGLGANDEVTKMGAATVWQLERPLETSNTDTKMQQKSTVNNDEEAVLCPVWYVQVIALKNANKLDSVQQALRQAGFSSVVVKEQPFYKVRVGPYSSQTAAKNALQQLTNRYAGAFIVKGSPEPKKRNATECNE